MVTNNAMVGELVELNTIQNDQSNSLYFASRVDNRPSDGYYGYGDDCCDCDDTYCCECDD